MLYCSAAVVVVSGFDYCLCCCLDRRSCVNDDEDDGDVNEVAAVVLLV